MRMLRAAVQIRIAKVIYQEISLKLDGGDECLTLKEFKVSEKGLRG